MNKRLIFLILIATLGLAACSASVDNAASRELPVAMEEVYMESEPIEAGSGYAPQADMASAPVPNTTVERLVIKNASLSIAVDDPEASMERISTLAEELDGYVVSAYMYQTTLESGVKVPHASISIRIPAEQLTAEYVDLGSRLANLEAAEEELQRIMEEAVRTEDVLAVYQQLTYYREQIEVIRGQMRYYEDSARLSMVSVELVANAAVQPLTIGGWQPAGVAKDAVQALIDTVKFLANAGIWIVIFALPVALLIFGPPALIVWLILRQRARRRKARQMPPATV